MAQPRDAISLLIMLWSNWSSHLEIVIQISANIYISKISQLNQKKKKKEKNPEYFVGFAFGNIPKLKVFLAI